MTTRFPRPLHERLRQASFDTRIARNTLVNQGLLLRLGLPGYLTAARDEAVADAAASERAGTMERAARMRGQAEAYEDALEQVARAAGAEQP
jgi:hypothetical protein